MKRRNKYYSKFQAITAVFLILALGWLTISAPFINTVQQKLANAENSQMAGDLLGSPEEESSVPLNGGTEEKAPGSNSLSEEYLHHAHVEHPSRLQMSCNIYHEDDRAYVAFHGELLVPPPNKA